MIGKRKGEVLDPDIYKTCDFCHKPYKPDALWFTHICRRTCKFCRQPFAPVYSTQLVCENCKPIEHQTIVKIHAKCKCCGTPFFTALHSQLYCSKECASLAAKLIERSYQLILQRDCSRCAYCGRTSFGDGIKLELDHVRPRKLGGDNTAGNLITSCEECNRAKNMHVLPNESEILTEVARRNAEQGIDPHTVIKFSKRAYE
jgi:hypothetical protein